MALRLLPLFAILTFPTLALGQISFSKTSLGESSFGSISLWGTADDTGPPPKVEVFGEGFDGPSTVTFSAYGTKTPRGELEIRFTPRWPGLHEGYALVHKHYGTERIPLVGVGDSAIPVGVYCEFRDAYPKDTRYPVERDWGGDTLGTFTSIWIRNHAFSDDTLQFEIPALTRLSPVSGQTSLRLAPDSSVRIWFELDSNDPGSAYQAAEILSNAKNLPVMSFHFGGIVESFPKLNRLPAQLAFYAGADAKHLKLANEGGRLLIVDLPELLAPFSWNEPTRHFEIESYSNGQYIVYDGSAKEEIAHTYWIRTNSGNLDDSVKLILKARPLSSNVSSGQYQAITTHVSADGLLISSTRGSSWKLYDITGSCWGSSPMDGDDQTFIHLNPGLYFLKYSSSQGGQHLAKVVISGR